MSQRVRIVLAQLDFLVGDIEGNANKIITTVTEVRDTHHADIVVFPELCLCGYPPEDLLFRESLQKRIDQALKQLATVKDIAFVLGLPEMGQKGLENRIVVMHNGKALFRYAKRELPNHTVFDEKRYFVPGSVHQRMTFNFKGINLGLAICEDLWTPAVTRDIASQGADIILSVNASPYDCTKVSQRREIMRKRCMETGLPLVYVNLAGAQDELVFDGASFVMDGSGKLVLHGDHYREQLYLADYNVSSKTFDDAYRAPDMDLEESIYQALVTGLRDYVIKNGFKNVILGLSGGIDSALVLAIAVDALGKEAVRAVMMPFHYTSSISMDAAREEALALGVQYSVLPIAPAYDGFMQILDDEFKELDQDITEENLQARCRGMLLMAISNKTGALVLTTGNKSELSVGYATLYGDMAGGFCVLKDVPKTMVYRLARWRNRKSHVIPDIVIERPPSAELAPDQVDQDSLPPYDILDEILRLYIEEDQSADAIVENGFEKESVYRVIKMVDASEYKRRQAPIGTRITGRAFGRDRRYPLTCGWKAGE